MRFLLCLIISIIWISLPRHTFWQWTSNEPDAFVVSVSPSSFDVNVPVDMTIKAVKNNGDTVTTYLGDVFIEIEWWVLGSQDYTIPSDGLYTYIASDLGVKTFSKGLMIKKPGTYKIVVSDVINENIKWEVTIIVWWTSNKSLTPVQVISPVPGIIENKSSVNILGKSELKNSPVEIYINNKKVKEDLSDTNGNFNIYVNDLPPGNHILVVKITDIGGKVIGQSSEVAFEYQPASNTPFKNIQILPSTALKKWDIATINVNTSLDASSVQLILADGTKYPLDKLSNGTFSKQIAIDQDGVFDIALEIGTQDGNKQTVAWVATLTIQPKEQTVQNEKKAFWIDQIKVFRDPVNKGSINVSRTTTWTSDVPQNKIMMLVRYGMSENDLSLQMISTWNELIIENLKETSTYYIQVQAVDMEGNLIGNPSEIVMIEPLRWSAPVCIIKGIKVRTGQVGDKYFLMRDEAIGVSSYSIFRSDFETSSLANMQKVWETTDTQFEYPFDPNTKEEQFAYYAVQANCIDGSALMIDDVKKVKVWPVTNALIVILASMIVYAFVKLHEYSKEWYFSVE